MSFESRLTPEQKAQARELWVALMFAPSEESLRTAREALKVASAEVRGAIVKAQVDLWRQGNGPYSKAPNPFE